jgi:hypothetical protein
LQLLSHKKAIMFVFGDNFAPKDNIIDN